MKLVDTLGPHLPAYAQDVRDNLDATLSRSSLTAAQTLAVALAAAAAAHSRTLVQAIRQSGELSVESAELSLSAAGLTAMSNVWYPYLEMAGDARLRALPSKLRMDPSGERDVAAQVMFDLCALAASIIGQCDFCVSSHLELLKGAGLVPNQLADVGRITATINAVAQILRAEGLD